MTETATITLKKQDLSFVDAIFPSSNLKTFKRISKGDVLSNRSRSHKILIISNRLITIASNSILLAQ